MRGRWSTSIVFAWVAPAALAACVEASRERACEPVDGSGCGRGERCVVDELGVPFCSAGGAESVVETGGACDGPNACRAAGEGCVSLFGLARCLPFCSPGRLDAEERCAAPASDGGEIRGRCLAILPDRPDIGVCVFPCDPADPFVGEEAVSAGERLTRCPAEDATCALTAELDFAVCTGAVGAAPADEGPAPCGPRAPCPPRFLCASWGDGNRCRPASPRVEGCAEGEAERILAGSGADRVAVCEPCTIIARDEAPAPRYLAVCHAPEPWPDAGVRCEREGGAPAGTDLGDDERRAALLAAVPAEIAERGLWVAGEGEVCRLLEPGSAEIVKAPCERPAHALCAIPAE